MTRKKPTAKERVKKKLVRRSFIWINTDQAIKLKLEFVPGPKPYIWFGGQVRGLLVCALRNDAWNCCNVFEG